MNAKEKKKWTGFESFRKLRRFSRPVFTLRVQSAFV